MLRAPIVLVLLASPVACVADTEFLDYDDLVAVTVHVEPAADVRLLASGADGGPFELTDVRGPKTVVLDVPRGGSVSSRMDEVGGFVPDIVWSFAGLDEGEEVTFVDFPRAPSVDLRIAPAAPGRRIFADLGCGVAGFASDEGLVAALACADDPIHLGLFELDEDDQRVAAATLTIPRGQSGAIALPEREAFDATMQPHTITLENNPSQSSFALELEGVIGSQRFGYFSGATAQIDGGATSATFELFPFAYDAYEIRVGLLDPRLEIRERTTVIDPVIDLASTMPSAEGEASLGGASWRIVGEAADVDLALLTFVTAEATAPNTPFGAVAWYVALPGASDGSWTRPMLPSAVAEWGAPDDVLRDVSVHMIGSSFRGRERTFEFAASYGLKELGRLEWRPSPLATD